MKKFLLVASIALIATACTKKEETSATTTENTEVTTPDTTSTNTVTPMDSATAGSATENNTAVEVINYVSNDGKTTFSGSYDVQNESLALKNETTGETYDMKRVPGASGGQYKDAKGYTFTEHQGKFYFGKDGKDLITGEIKK